METLTRLGEAVSVKPSIKGRPTEYVDPSANPLAVLVFRYRPLGKTVSSLPIDTVSDVRVAVLGLLQAQGIAPLLRPEAVPSQQGSSGIGATVAEGNRLRSSERARVGNTGDATDLSDNDELGFIKASVSEATFYLPVRKCVPGIDIMTIFPRTSYRSSWRRSTA